MCFHIARNKDLVTNLQRARNLPRKTAEREIGCDHDNRIIRGEKLLRCRMEQALGLHGFIVAFEDELGEPTGLELGNFGGS